MKHTILIVVMAIVSFSIQAQRFGVKSGLAFSTFEGDDVERSNTSVGYQLGGVAEFALSKALYVQPELSFVQKGATLDRRDYNSLYLDMPLNVFFKVALGSGIFTLGAGPYVSYGIGGNVEGSGFSQQLFSKANGEYEPILNRFDAGIGSSVGYEFRSGFILNIAESSGMLNVLNAPHLKSRNILFTISVGYKLNGLSRLSKKANSLVSMAD